MLLRHRWPHVQAVVVLTSACFLAEQTCAFAPCSALWGSQSLASQVRPHQSLNSVRTPEAAHAEEWREAVRPFLPPNRCRTMSPAESLRRGEWFKLICGASFEDLPAVRDLALVYTLAGADCIDVAAEEAVIEAARDGMIAALAVAQAVGRPMRAPWLMMSVNDDEEDPHFRKAVFDPDLCPADCPRPCETVCPADAVIFPDSAPPPAQRAAMVEDLLAASAGGGVLGPRCYGCGRCIAVCPPGIIRAEKYKRSPSVVRELLQKVDGVEIHTKGNLPRFRELWESCVAPAAFRPGFRVVAVSFPDLGDDTGLAVAAMGAVMEGEGNGDGSGTGKDDKAALVASGGGSGEGGGGDAEEEEETGRGGGRRGLGQEATGGEREGGGAEGGVFDAPAAGRSRRAASRPLNVWQTDGRPMSGDTGRSATVACIRLAQKVLDTRAMPFGEGRHFVQLAGGTNDRTAGKLREIGLIGDNNRDDDRDDVFDGGGSETRQRGKHRVGGVAYGGYARKAVGRVLDRLPAGGAGRVEHYPDVLSAALKEAALLVGGLKQPS